jgi:hypothetical protein
MAVEQSYVLKESSLSWCKFLRFLMISAYPVCRIFSLLCVSLTPVPLGQSLSRILFDGDVTVLEKLNLQVASKWQQQFASMRVTPTLLSYAMATQIKRRKANQSLPPEESYKSKQLPQSSIWIGARKWTTRSYCFVCKQQSVVGRVDLVRWFASIARTVGCLLLRCVTALDFCLKRPFFARAC